jgi:pimeloyl-ACP methyl ester carboxylesterase
MQQAARRGRALVAAAALAMALGAVPAAQAQARQAQDSCPRGARCATVQVPLDHAGGTPGTLGIRYARYPATGTRRGTIVYLEGGPGGAAIPASPFLAQLLRPLREEFDLVFPDQRGTGASSPLRCASLSGEGADASEQEAVRVARRCGEELGASRAFFTTYETVLDLEDLRRALGVERVIPLGVSYGGSVAGEYLRRFPASVEAAVLDSTSPIEGVDALGRLPGLALPRVLREVCFPPGCERFLRNPPSRLGTLAARLARRPLRGTVVLPSGRREHVRLGVQWLYAAVRISDADPFVRTELPAAIDAGLRGDAAPLLRLLVRGFAEDPTEDEDLFSPARFLATTCVEGRLPWDPRSAPESRRPLLEAALAEGAEAYAPFPVQAVLPALPAVACLGWPATTPPQRTGGTGPDLPVLVLAGREDLRTPLEDQRRAALQLPGAQVLAIPDAGHVALASDPTGCAVRAVTAFLSGEPVERCRRRPRSPDLALPVPGSLASLGVRGERRRTLVAAALTVLDADRQARAAAAVATGPRPRVGGLRGGTLEVRGPVATLARYEYVRGVRLSGRLRTDGSGRLTVTGSAATGTLTLRRGRLAGVLDGRRVGERLDG